MKYYILDSWDGVLFFTGDANHEKTAVTGKLVAYTTNYYRSYSEYEHKTPYTPTSLNVEGIYTMAELTTSGEPFTEVTEAEFNEEIAYYKKRGELVTDKVVITPTVKLEFSGEPEDQRHFIEGVLDTLNYKDVLALWDKAGEWFDFDEPYRGVIDDDTIVDYLIDAMEHGELSILRNGTIKF